MTQIATAAIFHEDKILIAKRPQGNTLAGLWEFPGGKLEAGESLVECLIREIDEELSLSIEPLAYLGERNHTYDFGAIKMHLYLVKIVSGELRLNVHEDFAWVDVDEISNYDLPPVNLEFLDALKNVTTMRPKFDKITSKDML